MYGKETGQGNCLKIKELNVFFNAGCDCNLFAVCFNNMDA